MPKNKKSPQEKERAAANTKQRIRMLGVKPEDGLLIREVLGILPRYRIEEHMQHPQLDMGWGAQANLAEEIESRIQ